MATQSFVSQGNFADSEMAVRSGAPTADFTRGLQVAGHAKSGVQQKTIHQQSIQQSLLHTITPDNFTSNSSIKNEGILICYSVSCESKL
jgi:hypothetical protein